MADAEIQYDEHVKAFFLDLAAKGKEAWNAWRRDPANEGVHVTFAGIDFSEAPRDGIDFSGFEFGDHADFSGCKWRGIKWKDVEDFEAFTPGRAYFTRAAFGYGARFAGAAFGGSARFADATFGNRAGFAGAAFGNGASFDNTVFKGNVDFAGRSNDQWSKHHVGDADEKGNEVLALAKRDKESWIGHGSGPDHFLTISFANARFDDVAYFNGRTFKRVANFTKARFYSPEFR
jgi:Pentapeptide repeats (9 copies)